VLAQFQLTAAAELDEARNYVETDRELLLRPGAGSPSRQTRPLVLAERRFVRFLQLEAADPVSRTHRRAPRRREKDSGASIAVLDLVPTHHRGSRAPRRLST
jgi:hypothetical protein